MLLRSVVLREESPLNLLDQNVYHLDMHFLNPVGILAGASTDIHISNFTQLGARSSCQTHYPHATIVRDCHSVQHVLAAPTGTDSQQAIACPASRLNITGKDVLIAEVVGNATDMSGIADRSGRQSRPVVPIPPRQFLSKMHGIA